MASDVAPERSRLPRRVALGIGGAVFAATVVAFLWPSLPFNAPHPGAAGATRVDVITSQLGGGVGRIGATAPDFEWVTPDGRTARLSSLRGHPVVINFWATWCDPCRAEMPLLDRAAADDPSTRFLAVDLDEDGAKIRAFFDQVGLRTLEPMLDVGLATSRRYGVASVPSTVFIDARGTIRRIHVGQMDEAALRRGLAAIR